MGFSQSESSSTNKSRSVVGRLAALAKPESATLALAGTALCVSSASNLGFPTIAGKVLDAASNPRGDRADLNGLLLSALGIFTFGAVASYTRVWSLSVVQARTSHRLRSLLFESLLDEDLEFFDGAATVGDDEAAAEINNSPGALVKLLSTDVESLTKSMAKTVSSGLRALNSVIGGTAMLLLISPKLTLCSLSIVPVVGVGAMLFGKRVRNLSRRTQARLGAVMGRAEERFHQIRLVKSYAREAHESGELNELLSEVSSGITEVGSAEGLMMGGISLSASLSVLTVLCVGGSLVARQRISSGELTSFVLYSGMVAAGSSSAAGTYTEALKAVGGSRRVFDILDRAEARRCALPKPPSPGAVRADHSRKNSTEGGDTSWVRVGDEGSSTILTPPSTPGRGDGGDIDDDDEAPFAENNAPMLLKLRRSRRRAKGRIKFDQVRFAYPSRPEVAVLNGLSLSVEAGEVVAVTGPSGCGKSTLGLLLLGLYRLDSMKGMAGCGRITLDNVDLSKVPPQFLREQIGVVAQEPTLFSGLTIAENINYGDLGATRAQVIAAARLADAHEFISALPEGYETRLGNGGGMLSVGQRQRVAISRALVGDPPILLLDEFTSALDGDSEAHVHKNMVSALSQSRTVLLIAHREASLRVADRVVVLGPDGTVLENGTYDALWRDENSHLRKLVAGRAIALVAQDTNRDETALFSAGFPPPVV